MPSLGVHIAFDALVAFVFALWLWADRIVLRAERVKRGMGPRARGPASWMLPALLLACLLAQYGIAATGVLAQFEAKPPRMLLFALTAFIATTAFAFSPRGRAWAEHLPWEFLIGWQIFRLPLELLLLRLHHEGVLPVQMTMEGRNYDVLTGVSAFVLLGAIARGKVPRPALVLWNMMGTVLLFVIVSIAVRSVPGPLRTFMNEPANTIVAHPPFVWLPGFLVQSAWLGHLLVFRKLRK